MGTVLLLLVIVAAILVVSLAAGLLVGGLIRVANCATAIQAAAVDDDAFVEYLRIHGHPPAPLDDDELARMLATWSRECSP